MAFILFNLAAVAALVGIDQLIKLWAVQALQPVGAMPFIPHVVELRFVLNQGMAFSLLSGKQLFLIIATSAALLAVAYGLFFRSRGKYLQQAALVLVLGGGIGNLIDRVLNGEVVDYINLLFMRFAVFNFADICVCVGVALWVLEQARAEKLIGASLEASVTLYCSDAVYDLLNSIPMDELADLMIVSHVELVKGEGGAASAVEGLGVAAAHATGDKCERCWKYSASIGSHPAHPTLCARCASVVEA